MNRLSTILPALLTGLFLGGGAVWLYFSTPEVDEPLPSIPPGQRMIEKFSCATGESKRVFLRGVEDNFSFAGEEFSMYRSGKNDGGKPGDPGAPYDGVAADKHILEIFTLPSNISDAMFVTSLREVWGGTASDQLIFSANMNGNTHFRVYDKSNPVLPSSTTRLTDLNSLSYWHQHGYAFSVNLGDLKRDLYTETRGSDLTVLDLVQAGSDTYDLAILIHDDTSVDFMGIVVCERPSVEFGSTFSFSPEMMAIETQEPPIIRIGCLDGQLCDHNRGDVACTEPLPLACFLDAGRPLQGAVPKPFLKYAWTGGELKFTEAVAGANFTTVDDVNNMCRSKFGPEWRILTTGDGGGRDILTYGRRPANNTRVWIDVPGVPYANCWAR